MQPYMHACVFSVFPRNNARYGGRRGIRCDLTICMGVVWLKPCNIWLVYVFVSNFQLFC